MPLAKNKKALFGYEILEIYEAGLVLKGYEVKSIKAGRMSLKGSYVVIRGGELWLLNASIPPYQPKNTPKDYNPEHSRKLLLTKKEINSLIGKSKQKGLTLVPLEAYNRHRRVKLKFALAKGKKKFDKREALRKKDSDKMIKKELRENS